MKREETNPEEQELLRALRTLAQEEKDLAAPPRVEAGLMREFDETRTVGSRHGRVFAGRALKVAALFVVAALTGYWWSSDDGERPLEQARVPEPAVSTSWPSSEALAWLDVEPESLQIV
jgi:hypothetical protein